MMSAPHLRVDGADRLLQPDLSQARLPLQLPEGLGKALHGRRWHCCYMAGLPAARTVQQDALGFADEQQRLSRDKRHAGRHGGQNDLPHCNYIIYRMQTGRVWQDIWKPKPVRS